MFCHLMSVLNISLKVLAANNPNKKNRLEYR